MPTRRGTRSRSRGLLLAGLAMLAATAGCGQQGVQRLRVYGTVTHQGKPVPAGKIRFEPNSSKGGSGPIGFARIVNGEYDCGIGGGKGPVAGPVRMKVIGYVSGERFAPAMFPAYTFEAELSSANREQNIDVP